MKAVTLAGVPVLLAAPATPAATRRPTVLWCHGFRADALAHAAELERCARAGFLAVGIDAVGHGARRDPALSHRIAEAGGALPVMLEQVGQTIAELPTLVDALVEHHQAERARVSLVGISMGAFLAYGAVASKTMPLAAVVALLGSPEWPGAKSAHQALDGFRSVALLSVTAEHDASVPPAAVARLHATLDARFGATPARRHAVLAGAGHLTSAQEWEQAMAATFDWIGRYGT